MRFAELADLHVAVWGYGREGRSALLALRRRFPHQHFTLFCNAAEAGEAATDLAAAQQSGAWQGLIEIVTHALDAESLARFDVVIKSPGISPYKAPVPEAIACGVRFTSASALWFGEHPQAQTICVTGTKGKSTVSALVAHLLRSGGQRVALAGNIGLPLLDLCAAPNMPRARAPDWWVIELSSFQTRDFAGAPTIAVITNIYEEHLDWHASRSNYVADKCAIATRARTVIVNADQAEFADMGASAVRVEFNVANGWHVRAEAIWRGDRRVLALTEIPLTGRHNAENVCAALAAVDAAGVDAAMLAAHVATFRPLPHRLQPLGSRSGVDFVNDSISTTPYAAIEALRSYADRSVTILVGGFDRGVSWAPFVDFVVAHPPHAIVTMGANGQAIAAALGAAALEASIDSAATLATAFARALALTEPGGVVMLSPGAPSFDQFHDYAERGQAFARLAGFEPQGIARIDGLGIA